MRDPDLSPAQREHLRVIDRNGEHLMALITDILEMSKIEANRATLNRSPFVVSGLARDLESMFRARIIAQGLAFIVEIDESCGERLVGDVSKLRQIFVNLLANAIKFTITGRIILRFRAEPLLDGTWCLRGEVEDTGPGIPPAFIGQLFDEFAQTDLGQRTGSGTGLGLPISRQFARMMEGDIAVETREGHGTLFRVSVILTRDPTGAPADLSRRNGSAETFVQLAPGQPEQRILVVDDQADSRQFLRLLLVGAGFAVREAANGSEAVSVAESWQPRCILMDLRMPVMGGIEAITEIRRHEYGRAIRIISLTASVFVEDRAQVLAAGADRFMTKPVHVTELFEQIAVLNDVRYIRSGVGADKPPAQDVVIKEDARLRIPATLSAQLRDAVEAADLDMVLALTDELALLDEPAAVEIRRIVNRFDYPALLALLDASETKS
jgi:CheY-like chemotaxis protein